MKTLRRSGCAVLLLGSTLFTAGWAQEWGKTRLVVVPGKSVGSINLGDKLSDNTKKFLGKASDEEPATGKAYASGYSLWGKGDVRDLKRGLRLRFSDGKDLARIVSIEVAGLRASTEQGLFLGELASKVSKIYPDAQYDLNPITRNPEFAIPGLVARTQGGKVSQLIVEPLERSAWRFTQLKVLPGKSIGPFVLGKPVSPEVYKLLGQPTSKVAPGQSENSGYVRWSLPGRSPNRMIEAILHDGVHPYVITHVIVRGTPAITDQKVKIGDDAATVKSIYSDGKPGLDSAEGGETWRVPGLNLELVGNKLKGMQIYKASRAE